MTKGAISENSKLTTQHHGALKHPKNVENVDTENPEKLNFGREFMDVTWRMAVPVVIFAGLGLLGDRTFGSKPMLTLLGTMVGFLFAAILVKKQIGELPQDDPDMIEISRAKRAQEKDDEEEDDK